MTASYTQCLAAHGVNASLTLLPTIFAQFAAHDCDSARSAAAEGRIPQGGFPLSKMYVYDWSNFVRHR